ncbi:hypothetical protein CVT24_007326 [Panaeolus cyanescens]|uniref:F-box domain-containing protein n=1 Tax=Panaeolus cyanescens TaxID=181874 RepID=A0A409W5C8_9AGAR|nr:hypothetical protein CVT24_007326 [Panaeolus cyanescens]
MSSNAVPEGRNLPVEIVDEIIGQFVSTALDTDTPHRLLLRDLSNISTVSPVFLRIARSHIFKKIAIFIGNSFISSSNKENLSALFTREPTIAKFVKHITCQYNADVPHNGQLAPLFQLPNVQSLTLALCLYRRTDDETIQYFKRSSDISSTFGVRALLEHYLKSGSLKMVTLTRMMPLPCNVLLESPTLESVSIYQSFASSEEVVLSPNSTSQRSNIKKLILVNTTIPFAFLARSPKLQILHLTRDNIADFSTYEHSNNEPALPSLEELNLTINSYDDDLGQGYHQRHLQVILDHSPILKNLSLSIPLSSAVFLTIPRMPQLETLSLNWCGSTVHPHTDIVKSAIQTMSSCRLPSESLKNLNLRLSIDLRTMTESLDCMKGSIRKVIALAMDRDCRLFPRLQKVSLIIRISIENAPEEVRENIESELQALITLEVHDEKDQRATFDSEISVVDEAKIHL